MEGDFGGVTEIHETTGDPVKVLTSTPSTSYEFSGPTAIVIKKPDAWVFSPDGGSGGLGAITGFNIATGDLVGVTQENFSGVPEFA